MLKSMKTCEQRYVRNVHVRTAYFFDNALVRMYCMIYSNFIRTDRIRFAIIHNYSTAACQVAFQ